MSTAQYLEDLFGLNGQVAVVIGGAGVLGASLARGLGQAGAHVVIADISEERCQARVDELTKCGCKASYGVVDVTSRKSLETLLSNAREVTGRVEILVNCAGVNAGTTFLEATEADWDRIMAINL